MMELEKRYELDFTQIKALTVVKPNIITRLISKLKLLFKIGETAKNVS